MPARLKLKPSDGGGAGSSRRLRDLLIDLHQHAHSFWSTHELRSAQTGMCSRTIVVICASSSPVAFLFGVPSRVAQV